MSNENERYVVDLPISAAMADVAGAPASVIERIVRAVGRPDGSTAFSAASPILSDEAVERAMAAFIASVREQDSQWTDEVDEGEQLLVSPAGDYFAMDFPMIKALTAAFSPPPEPVPSSPVPVAWRWKAHGHEDGQWITVHDGATASAAIALFASKGQPQRVEPLYALPAAPAPREAGEPDACPICLVAFKPDDMCLTDIDLGTCHAACLEGSPMVDLETGDPLPEGVLPKPYRYEPDAVMCGGCGNSDPHKRCIGCGHDFYPTPPTGGPNG